MDDFSTGDLAAIERTTQEVGRYLFDHLQTRQPGLLSRRWWDDRIMAWAMQDESVKVQMFRFIDVLPMLTSSQAITQHLHEYFDEVRKQLPSAARLGMAVARPRSLAGRALAIAARRNAMAHARRFIAGTDTREVLAAAMRERKLKRAFTLDVLGEAVTSDSEADRYLQMYLDLIDGIAPTVNSWAEVPQIDRGALEELPRVNVSVKLSALDSQFDPIDPEGTTQRVAGRLRQLLRAARRQRAFVHVDMESYHVKDLTLRIFQDVLAEDEFRDSRDVGIVIQCYLKDAGRDLEQLLQWAQWRKKPIWIRLVKGAYWDFETIHARAEGWPIPVFENKWETDANFERQTRFVMRNQQWLRPAIASHNIRSLAHGIAVARHIGLPPGAFELQMLYGMADPEKQAIVELGHRLRIYMPYGELIPGMAYLVRRLLENTSNDSFLRASFTEHVSPDVLLTNPLDRGVLEADVVSKSLSPPPVVSQVEPGRGQGEGSAQNDGDANAQPIVIRYFDDGQENSTMATTNHDAFFPPFHNEPHADFAVAAQREAMQTALADVKSRLGRHEPLWIGGRAVDTNLRVASLNPSQTRQIVGTVANATKANVDEAVAVAKAALPDWAALGAQGRAEFLVRTADVLRRRRFELAAWEVYECGKGWREADGDVCEAIDFCEYYARAAVALESPHGVDVPGEENRFEYRPRGVTAVIAPWNFPLAILTGMATAALATGNTVLMKPSEQSAVIGSKLMEAFREAELPPGVANFVPGKGEVVGAAMVEHPDVALIAFTGSREVGLSINRRAAEISAAGIGQVKRVIAEMGGKNAIIIDDDADLDEAVLAVAKSAFGYQGQKCSACSRVIVLDSIYDTFLSRLVEATRSLKVGPADEPSTSVGPVIDAASLARIRRAIEEARPTAREALAVDVGPLADQGFFVGPHIFADVPPNSRLAQEEIFGPVLAVIRAKDLTEALKIANGTQFALTGGIFSRSPAAIERARREFQVGNLYINRGITGALVGRQPFGGFKMSGIGSQAGGPDYLLQFVLPRTITENTLRRGFAPSMEDA